MKIKSKAPFSPTQHESLALKIKRHMSQYVYEKTQKNQNSPKIELKSSKILITLQTKVQVLERKPVTIWTLAFDVTT